MQQSFCETLRDLILESDLTLKSIAKQAGVKYQPLQRWVQGVTEKYDVAAASKVHTFLTNRKENEA